MNKEQFLKTLDSALKGLSSDEREDIIRDFEEHFLIGFKEGNSEEKISATLGSPKQIAKELLATYHLEKVEGSATTGNILRAMYAVIGLGFLNLVFVLGPFIALLGVMAAGWVIGLGFTISPLVIIVGAAINPGTFELFALFFSLGLCGVGLLLLLGMRFASKLAAKGLVRYLKFNMKIVKGGNDDE